MDMILVGAFSLDTAEIVAGLITCEVVLRGSTPATSTFKITDCTKALYSLLL